jgi:hypothetical protein
MINMAYCRFQNTLPDFMDCVNNLSDDLNEREHFAREQLILSSVGLLGKLGVELDEDQLIALCNGLGELAHG